MRRVSSLLSTFSFRSKNEGRDEKRRHAMVIIQRRKFNGWNRRLLLFFNYSRAGLSAELCDRGVFSTLGLKRRPAVLNSVRKYSGKSWNFRPSSILTEYEISHREPLSVFFKFSNFFWNFFSNFRLICKLLLCRFKNYLSNIFTFGYYWVLFSKSC